MSFSSQPGWPEMKYGTRYCSFPASSLYFSKASLKRTNWSLPGFFITRTTPGEMCSGAILRCPPTWLATSSRMYSSPCFSSAEGALARLLVGEGDVVADPARHEGALHSRKRARLSHELDEGPVIGSKFFTNARIHA